MKLVDLLSPERVVVPVRGETLRKATGELVDALRVSGAVSDPDRIEQLVADTLPRDVVTVGQAFLLYFRTDAVPTLTVTLGIAPEPMHREHDPSKQARIVLLIMAPPKESSPFLRAVSGFSRALGREEIVEALLAAEQPADVLAIAPLAEAEVLDYLTVRDVMVHRTLSVRPDTSLGEASRIMVTHRVPALPVVSEANEVLGMVGHRELLRHLLPVDVKRIAGDARAGAKPADDAATPHAMPVRTVMDRSVLCVSEDQTVAEVASMMLNRNVDRFPVVRDGVLIGFLGSEDIVRRLFGR